MPVVVVFVVVKEPTTHGRRGWGWGDAPPLMSKPPEKIVFWSNKKQEQTLFNDLQQGLYQGGKLNK